MLSVFPLAALCNSHEAGAGQGGTIHIRTRSLSGGRGYRPQNLGSQHGPLRFGVPDPLKAFPYAEADFRAYGKLDNFYGLSVGRMPPVPGVLAYDRDKVVDLKAAAAPVASGPDAPTP